MAILEGKEDDIGIFVQGTIYPDFWMYLKFSQLKDDKIPKDLFDYVSFLNEAPVPVVYKKSKGSTSKARGRGRPAVLPAPAPGVLRDTLNNAGTPLDSATTAVDSAEIVQDTQLDDQLIKEELVNETVEEPETLEPQYIKITHTHPLMGLWEGYFNVKSATGL